MAAYDFVYTIYPSKYGRLLLTYRKHGICQLLNVFLTIKITF